MMEPPAVGINLTIAPPFCPGDVELCHIERLVCGTKCDLVFVFKNFKKQFYKVKDVCLTSLAGLKDQLNCLAIKFTEGIPHNWPKIRKTISRDPEKFYDSGGWSFLESNTPDVDDKQAGDDDVGDDVGVGVSDDVGVGVGDDVGVGVGVSVGVGPPRRKKTKKESVVAEDSSVVTISSSGEVWLELRGNNW